LQALRVYARGQGGAFWKEGGGLDNMGSITIERGLGTFEERTENGILTPRYSRFSSFLDELGLPPSAPRLKTYALVHEYGHGDAIAARALAGIAQGETEADSLGVAYDEMEQVVDGFKKIWDVYYDRIFDLIQQGDKETWHQYVEDRDTAYSRLPVEFNADTFALDFFSRHSDLLA
jgi:hypothetical protein